MIDIDKYERMLKDETYRLDGRNNMMALTLLAEIKRLRKWIYHHANNLDAGGVHRMGTPQPLSTFADEAREAIGVKRGESLDI